MKDYGNILVVSKSDTCIGPMAAATLRRALIDENISVASRGVRVLFPEPINEKAEAVMISNGHKIEGYSAKALSEEDIDDDTMLVAMSEEEYRGISERFQQPEHLYLLAGLIGEDVVLPEPYGQDFAAYGSCYETVERWMTMLAEVLEGEKEEA